MCKKFFMSYQKPIKGRCKFFGQRLISNDECTNFMNKEILKQLQHLTVMVGGLHFFPSQQRSGGLAGFLSSLSGGFGGLTPLSVLATALVALLDFLAAFPEFLGGLFSRGCRKHLVLKSTLLVQQIFLGFWLSSRGAYHLLASSGVNDGTETVGSFGLLSCNVLGKIFLCELRLVKTSPEYFNLQVMLVQKGQ